MFRKNRKDKIPWDRPYTREAMRYLKRREGGAEQLEVGGNKIDRYMYENIMATLKKNYGNDMRETTEDILDDALTYDRDTSDSISLRVSLPLDKARQLQALAREFDEEPRTLARMWIIERLKQLWHDHALPLAASAAGVAVSRSLSDSPSHAAETSPPAAEVTGLAQAKIVLAEKYITDPEERHLFLQTFLFKQWGNYIAGLVLTNTGNSTFTVEDIKRVLRYDLMPEYYNTPGAEESALSTHDVEVDAPGDAPAGFASLKRVAPGVFKFIGFKKAKILRAGR